MQFRKKIVAAMWTRFGGGVRRPTRQGMETEAYQEGKRLRHSEGTTWESGFGKGEEQGLGESQRWKGNSMGRKRSSRDFKVFKERQLGRMRVRTNIRTVWL